MSRITRNVQDPNLRNILDSGSYGVVKLSQGGGLEQSKLFAGFARITSSKDPQLQQQNNQTRVTFVNSLINEFNLSIMDQDSLRSRLCFKGDGITEKTTPISIRSAKRMIEAYAKGKDMKEHIETTPIKGDTYMKKELHQTMADPKFFGEDIERALRDDLIKEIKTLKEKGASAEDVFKYVSNWCEDQARSTDVGTVNQFITELGFMTEDEEKRQDLRLALGQMKDKGANAKDLFNHVQKWSVSQGWDKSDLGVSQLMNRLGFKTERDEMIDVLRSDVKQLLESDATRSEIIEHATDFAKTHNLPTDPSSVKDLLREADYRN